MHRFLKSNIGIGMTGWYLGIPFLIGPVALLHESGLRSMALAYLVALAPLGLALSVDVPASKWHFPGIGAQVNAPAGWGIATYERDPRPYLQTPGDLRLRASYDRKDGPAIAVFPQPMQMRLARMETRHPDLQERYSAVLEHDQGTQMSMDESEFLQAVNSGTLLAPTLIGHTQLQRPLLQWMGYLMYWPIFPVALPVAFAPGP